MNVELENNGRTHVVVLEKGLAVYIQPLGRWIDREDEKAYKKAVYEQNFTKYPALIPGWAPVAKVKAKQGPGKVNTARKLAKEKIGRRYDYPF